MSTEPARTADAVHCYRHPDRETLLSCSNCGKPICTECMSTAAVGIRCPDCAGGRTGVTRVVRPGRIAASRDAAPATMAILAVNVLVFGVELIQGVSVRGGLGGSSVAAEGGVFGPAVADGEWYRMLTAGFIHAGLFHLAFNMFALWWLGGALERYAGTTRMLAIYLTSILWGSAGALLLSPTALTVGASGGVFGLMGALLVLERQQGIALLGSGVGMFLLLNLAITFLIPGISIGGHLGGLVGGAACALVLSGFGKGHLAYGRLAPAVIAGVVALMAGAVAVGVIVA
ncbi:MAG: rhomboid family intramembrane serine protease [Thermoleophilia bacterium]|nr:rhomboid family intramembrane serine protease [Thermoleophilia bacterium]